MKAGLRPGIEHELRFIVPESKTVPALYPESPEFREMPPVFATGFLVGLLEWACIEALKPHLDWPREQSVGTHIDVSHSAATRPGLEVAVKAKLVEVDGRRLAFEVEAHDGVDLISRGRHERYLVDGDRFREKTRRKLDGGDARGGVTGSPWCGAHRDIPHMSGGRP
jgi:fluoroacetyl-CoA thioesterase